jgi:predicted transcriptional regulator
MIDTTPPLHPIERDQRQSQSILVVTVETDEDFHAGIVDAIESLADGESLDSTPMLSFGSYEELMGTLTPRVLELIETVRREEPGSINETARAVDRDVKNVHEELTRLARLGIISFEEEGRRRRPVVWFEELVIDLPFESKNQDATTASP